MDRKGFHTLHECDGCHLLFRHPRESPGRLFHFYQSGYDEPGLTTELPNAERLDELLRSGFRGSEKDFSYHISILQSLGARPGTRVLDYGANWGYASYQFLKAGFEVEAYEISVSRAAYGGNLGLRIITDADQISGDFDIVYSCHVLEHAPNPTRMLREQMSYVRPGGLLVAHTPNGSAAFRELDSFQFHRIWGKPHPVLLRDRYVAAVFATEAVYVSSTDVPQIVERWSQRDRQIAACEGAGLFFAARRA